MGYSGYDGIRLPKSIRDELGISLEDARPRKRPRLAAGNRQAVRQEGRARAKELHRPKSKAGVTSAFERQETRGKSQTPLATAESRAKSASAPPLQATKAIDTFKKPGANSKKISRNSIEAESAATSAKWKKAAAQEDAEISALEKALGLKDSSSYPRVFEEEGLEDLLDGLHEIEAGSVAEKGKAKTDLDDWRSQRRGLQSTREDDGTGESSDFDGFDGDIVETETDSVNLDSGMDDMSGDDCPDRGIESFVATKPRENPYRPPSTQAKEIRPTKYIPPSLRNIDGGATEDFTRLRRRLQGQLNRLSEANLLSVAKEVESISKEVARQSFFSSLGDLIVERLIDRSALNDTYIILIAGFTSALCKLSGPEFAALIVARLDTEFSVFKSSNQQGESDGKQPLNIAASIAQLYIFQVIGVQLVYDYIRLLITEVSELNTEILLRMIRIAGQQIRHDDPTALAEIVVTLRRKVLSSSQQKLSVRTKFMLEIIEDLKNNKVKHGLLSASLASEHTISMKKILGTLNQRSLKMTEPLGVSLKDVRDSSKQGRWWLVGASYQEPQPPNASQGNRVQSANVLPSHDESEDFDHVADLALLARENGMNTDVRRAIFVAIMSSSDCNDATTRLRKLGLKRSQEVEIPKVIVRCAASEQAFNPFYGALLSRVCTDRKLKMAVQFSIWDTFKRMGESNDTDEGDETEFGDSGDSKLSLREVVNLARTFGTVIGGGGGHANLAFLKVLNLTYLQRHTRIFLEVLFTTMILQTQAGQQGKDRNEAQLVSLFVNTKGMADMAGSLQFFIREVLAKSDIAESSAERRTVKWGCRVACDALAALMYNAQ